MKRLCSFSLVCLLAGAMLSVPMHAQDPLEQQIGPPPPANQPGLLFYLSGDSSFKADYAAGGVPDPNYQSDVKILPGGAKGGYIQCGNNQLLSYWAPGNIYAKRGTLSFYWRSRDPVDETEFPVFRVGYADHSSWDQVWLRIDYNGHGFDAFVTDVNLGRTRVSYTMPNFPKPDQWVHLTLTWDETTGIRFYVDGKLAAEKAATGMFDAALDQFGPHSRIIGPTGVESSYSYDRGGDIDELRIYDRALSDENVASLAKGNTPQSIPPLSLTLANAATMKEWWFHYGWNRPGDIPTPLTTPSTVVRKVQINDAYDIGRWWFRGMDGIRETTWPGVYNRSRLVGRWDYFQLPDWDCYAISGKTVTFIMPNEPWNHLEFSGGAFGKLDLLTPDVTEDAVRRAGLDGTMLPAKTLFDRPSGQETTFHDFATPVTGGKLRFTNVEEETPIGEFSAYYVHPGDAPQGLVTLRYRLTANAALDANPSLTPLLNFIHDRYPAGERSTVSATAGGPAGGGGGGGGGGRRGGGALARTAPTGAAAEGMPIVHVLIPADFRGMPATATRASSYTWDDLYAGLDGIAVDLPALNLAPTHGAYIAMNIEVRDPLWPMRDMLNFTFSVKPGEAHTLWLDTRDRILPNDKSLLITIASASAGFNASLLEGAALRLIFKPYKDAVPEHVADRLAQVRDNFSNMTEEHVSSRRLNTYNRFYADISDLLRVDPGNDLGRKYWHEWNPETLPPDYTQPTVPAGVPAWAYLQAKDVDYFQRIADFYIDKRQAWDGEFGGGLGDDSDFTNLLPSLALMGTEPEKMKASLSREFEEMYENKMWTNGLATGQYDELHSYEDGINVLGQSMMMDFGNPKDLERAMLTAKRLEDLTGVNAAGHRHIRSAYFSGTKMATGGVWGWTKARGYMDFHPALDLVLYNGAPETRKMVLETVDGMLAHRKQEADGRWVTRTEINFKTDEDLPGGDSTPDFMFWAAYRWTGDKKYVAPFMDAGPSSLPEISSDALDALKLRDTWGKQVVAAAGSPATAAAQSTSGSNETFAWLASGDTGYLERLYRAQLQAESNREWINTEGSLWIDRVTDSAGPMFVNTELQRARFGGTALVRNHIYPGNAVSWRFVAPATPSSVGILVPEATPDHVKIIVYNLDAAPVAAAMTGWEIDPGKWEMAQGTRDNADTDPVQNMTTRTVDFERSRSLDVTFAPHTTTVLELKLVEKGVPYWSRPDLGISADDIKVDGNRMKVTVHSLGSVDAPAAKVVLRDRTGKVLASANAAPLKAPLDLTPKTETVSLAVPTGADWKGGSVTIESSGKLPEITQMNNRVQF